MSLRFMAALLLGLTLLGACEPLPDDSAGSPSNTQSSGPYTGPKATHQGSGSSWTVLVYMVADNNLEPAALDDLQEMMQAGSNDSVHIVVLCDRRPGLSNQGVGGLPDWTSTKRLLVQNGSLQELADLGEQNLGDPQVLADFIAWGVQKYPADRYALLLWDHGGGVSGFGSDETNDDDTLSLPELDQALRSGMKAAGIQQFGVIGFDACLMATYETAVVMRPFAEYLLASEETEPGFGWNWASLQILRDDPTTGPEQLGVRIVQDYQKHAQSFGESSAITLSLTDLVALDVLDSALSGLQSGLTPQLATQAAGIGQQVGKALEFGKAPNPEQGFHTIDLGDLAGNLAQAALSTAQSQAVQAAMQQIVKAKVAGQTTANATGLSIYFPTQQSYYRNSYNAIPGIGGWRAFLKAWYSAGTAAAPQGPQFSNADHLADGQWGQEGWTVSGSLTQGSAQAILLATAYFGTWDDASQTATLYMDQPADVAQNAVTSQWNGKLLQLAQGGQTALAYMSLTVEQAAGKTQVTLEVPLDYWHGTDERYIVLRRVIDADSGQVVGAGYFEYTADAVAAFYPEPDGKLFPIVANVDSSGQEVWQATTAQPFSPDQLELQLAPAPSGQAVYAEIDVEVLGDQGDYVYTVGKVP